MTAIVLAAVLVGGSPAKPLDEDQPDGAVYHHFDYELMVKIRARNEAKRAAMKEWDYDPVTWLPVPEEKTKRPRPYHHRDDGAIRAARMHRAALRRQQAYGGGGDPLWWIYAPAMPNPRCPWSYVTVPAITY